MKLWRGAAWRLTYIPRFLRYYRLQREWRRPHDVAVRVAKRQLRLLRAN